MLGQTIIQRVVFTLLLILMLGTSVKAQEAADTVNQTVDGKKSGWWHIVAKNGRTSEGCFVAGKKNGRWKNIRPDGTIESFVTFSMGIPRGLAIYYHKNGKIMEEGFWNVDHWEGTYTRNNEKGVRAVEFNFNAEGKREGPQIYYHPNGKVMYEGSWANGVIKGPLSIFDEDGVKVMERTYGEDGKFAGNRDVDPSEDKDSEASLEQFRGTGQYTLFNKDGSLYKKGYFQNGKLINGNHYIYKNGKLSRTDKYVNGEKQ